MRAEGIVTIIGEVLTGFSSFSDAWGDVAVIVVALLWMALCFVRFAVSLQKPLGHTLVPPSSMGLAMTSIALWTSNQTFLSATVHFHLTMLPFILACFIRFAGTSIIKYRGISGFLVRMFSRSLEYAMILYAFLNDSTRNPLYAVPLIVLLSIARTNEVLRVWRSQRRRTSSERQQFRVAAETFMKTVKSPGINSIHSPRHIEKSNDNDKNVAVLLGFLWINGSGTLITSMVMLLIYSLVDCIGKSGNMNTLSLLVCIIHALLLLYSLLQCLPALLVRIMLKSVASSSDLRSNDHVFCFIRDIWSLLGDILQSEHSPFGCAELSKYVNVSVRLLETLELFLHLLVAVFARLSLQAVQLLFLYSVKLTRFENLQPYVEKILIYAMRSYPTFEFDALRKHFLTYTRQYAILQVSFERKDSNSMILLDTQTFGTRELPQNVEFTMVLEGYCPCPPTADRVAQPGYGRLTGAFLDLEQVVTTEGKGHLKAVTGGWVRYKNQQDDKWIVTCTWGNARQSASGDPVDGGDDLDCVARIYQGTEYMAVWREPHLVAELEMYLQWGPVTDAIPVTHLWKDKTLMLGLPDCAPPFEDLRVYADNVVSFPFQTTWRMAWERKESFP